jgi:hypothetical protein
MLTSALNPRVVKSGLDELFMPEFNQETFLYHADANDTSVFRQKRSTKGAEQIMELKGSGSWKARNEIQESDDSQPQALYYQTITNATLANGMTISKELVDDQQVDIYGDSVVEFAMNGRSTRDSEAFSLYRTGFTATGGDGEYIFDTDHPITGGTMSNKLTVVLSEANLNTAIIALQEQKKRDGIIRGNLPSVLLVPTALFAEACRLTDAKAIERPGTGNRDTNVYSTKYNIMVKTSPYLGTAAGGNDAYWWLMSRNHGMLRYERQAIETKLLTPKQMKADTYWYSGNFRQSVGVGHPFGIVGSTGGV